MHPIAVHIPNGILPISVIFCFIAALLDVRALETAAFWNQVVVLSAMPGVIFTGYCDWQSRYKGALTKVFKIKLTCAAAVTVLIAVSVIWQVADPHILTPFSTGRRLFLLVQLLLLGAAVTAGYYGGKLVFRD